MSEEKKKKCGLKCSTCHYYDKKKDFCKEKEVEECSKKALTEFSNCESYLMNEKLVFF